MEIAAARTLIAAAALISLSAGAVVLLVVQPTSSGMSIEATFAEFQPGSMLGVVIWGTPWVIATAAVVVAGGISTGRRGRPVRWVVVIGWACFAAAVGLIGSWLPFTTMELGLEKVTIGELRDRTATLAAYRTLWLLGLLFGAVALAAGILASRIPRPSRSV